MCRMLSMMTVLLITCSLGNAQEAQAVPLSYYLPSVDSYDPAIPTPEDFFGFQVGEWHLQPDQIHAYIRELARLSDRITVDRMGRTYEEREILLATITSPSNHARLAEIREQHLALSDPTRASGVDLASQPVVVWMGYSVHGNEASGSNASVLVAYYLTASRGNEIESALNDAIILLNPSINPDGLNRFSSWVNANRGMVLDPSSVSREHREPWPGGRSNHYWFDLNRDWMPLQHPESRARIERYYEWRPNVLTDHHEMGAQSTFFFQPGIPSRNNPLVPGSVSKLTGEIARFHARDLDSIGSLYYSEESFDDFYIGKGSSYPDITGGIGILFEQASARGHAQKTSSGVLTFPFAIRNQVTTSVSTLRAAVHMKEDLLAHQRDMARSALSLAERSPTKAYVFGAGSDRASTRALARVLVGHQIDVFHLSREIKADGHIYRPGEGFIVPVDQVQYRLLSSLFERRTEFEDSLFYDVSAWSLPMAFGLPYEELRSMPDDALGRPFDPKDPAALKPMPASSPFYAFSWSEFYAPRALERLFSHHIIPRMAFQQFTGSTPQGEHTFDAGSVIIAVGGQTVSQEKIREVLDEIRSRDGIEIHGLSSGLTGRGIDLGSPSVVVLEQPRIALVAGPGVSPTDAGEIWHLLDQRYSRTVTLLDPSLIRKSVLDDFNVVVMPAGGYGAITKDQTEDVLDWIRSGNTLIAQEQAISWVIGKNLAKVSLKADARTDTSTVVLYAEQEPSRGAKRVPGAIVLASVDRTHPLFFGFATNDVYVFKSTSYAFKISNQRAITPATYARQPLVSGYLHDLSVDHFKNEAPIAVVANGRGRVILMADNYTFRAFWYGTSRVLSNAIYLAPYMRVSSSED